MPDPQKQSPAVNGASGAAGERASEANPSALRRLRGVLPMIGVETRIALDVARDVHLTGGCSIEDGRRLATAYQRLRWAMQAVADAEREAPTWTK